MTPPKKTNPKKGERPQPQPKPLDAVAGRPDVDGDPTPPSTTSPNPSPHHDVRMIAACDDGGVIGYQGRMPWPRLRADMRRFRSLTMGGTLICGRLTWEAMGPLKGRRVVLVSKGLKRQGVYLQTEGDHQSTVAGSLPEALDALQAERVMRHELAQREGGAEPGSGVVWLAGGERIYHEGLDVAREIYLTRILGRWPGDRFFPVAELLRRAARGEWVMAEHTAVCDEKTGVLLEFERWVRVGVSEEGLCVH